MTYTIKEINSMLDNISQAPWSACHDGECKCSQVWTKDDHPVAIVTKGNWGDDYPSIRLVGEELERKAEAYMEQINYGTVSNDTAIANTKFIAAAPEIVKQLLDKVNTLEAYIENLEFQSYLKEH
jgi:hypothetical protein